jgi:hypothetical protein
MKKPTLNSENTISVEDIQMLRSQIEGALLLPGDHHYNEASQAWNLNAQQRPAILIVAASVADIEAGVRFANHRNIGIGVMATGHGIGKPCNGGLLINTSKMRGVTINPVSQTATVEAGALWKDVIAVAYAHGLASLAGSAPHVGVVGYTMGGGFGYLGRKYGLNSASVIAADVVTSEGALLRVNADENQDLLWAVKGGGGNFGIVTSLQFRLYPIAKVYGGAVFYEIEHGHGALTLYAQWAKTIPDEITAAFAFMNIPPIPAVPEKLRGRSVVVIKGCYCGEKPEFGEQLFAPVRTLGKPLMDTFGIMPVTSMDAISKDPVDPMGILQYGGLIDDLSSQAIDAFVKIAGAGSGSPFLAVEFRKLGGALAFKQGNLDLLGSSGAQFSFNTLGATLTPLIAEKVQAHLALFLEVARPYQTSEVFLNFMEVDPSEERVRAAYSPEDWKRLVMLKSKYDPRNIFRFNRNIPPHKLTCI